MTFHSSVFRGEVVHLRLRPKRHRLSYKVYMLLLDLDELPNLDRCFRFFGYNRWAPIAFHDRDHGSTTGMALRPWVENHLRNSGINPDGGTIRLLCFPRIFGYTFNPISVYFCYRRDGNLDAILYEVCNTYRERHTYVMPVSGNDSVVIQQICQKKLYVSPFIGMEAVYHFVIAPPGETVSILIREDDSEGHLLTASFHGDHSELNARTLARSFGEFPLLTLKVIVAIHWEALKLWLKGVPIFTHVPATTPIQSSMTPAPPHNSRHV